LKEENKLSLVKSEVIGKKNRTQSSKFIDFASSKASIGNSSREIDIKEQNDVVVNDLLGQ